MEKNNDQCHSRKTKIEILVWIFVNLYYNVTTLEKKMHFSCSCEQLVCGIQTHAIIEIHTITTLHNFLHCGWILKTSKI